MELSDLANVVASSDSQYPSSLTTPSPLGDALALLLQAIDIGALRMRRCAALLIVLLSGVWLPVLAFVVDKFVVVVDVVKASDATETLLFWRTRLAVGDNSSM